MQKESLFFFKKDWLLLRKAVPLHHENPPSLSMMLKIGGSFLL